ncbi:hypothetical protein ACIBCT_30370 [Streptosporangium sp. NPDC050855]|uniref:hypothetical protein n=1 Tax=Streptosporangium sp. NPDC050855 TaxID=3366194 RepID=UPI0037AF60E4
MTIVVDADDDYHIIRAALGAHDVAKGVLTVHPTVGISAMAALAQDILVALGKLPTAVVKEPLTATAMWMTTTAWVIGMDIRQLVILRAHRLPRPALARLVQLAADANTSLTLVWHARPPATWEGLLPTATIRILQAGAAPVAADEQQPPVAAFADAPEQQCSPLMSKQRQEQARLVMCQALPEVPQSNVLHFRANAFRALSREDFARVDLLYTSAMDATCAFLSAHPDYCKEIQTSAGADLHDDGKESGDRDVPDGQVAERLKFALDDLAVQIGGLPSASASLPRPWEDSEAIARFVTELVVAAPSHAHTVALLHGAQAGFLLHGIHLVIPADPEKLGGPGFVDPPLTPAVAEQIRSHIIDPVRAGALTAFLATGLSAWWLSLISMCRLEPDASILRAYTPFKISYPIPLWARDLLAAARAFAVLQNCDDDERFLATGIGVGGKTLADTAQRCGLNLQEFMLDRHRDDWRLQMRCFWVALPFHPRDHAIRRSPACT